jgi:hypothetical protein
MEPMLGPMYPIVIEDIAGYLTSALGKGTDMGTIASILWIAANVFLLAVTGVIVGAAISSGRGAKRVG